MEIPVGHARQADHSGHDGDRHRRTGASRPDLPWGTYRLTITDPKSTGASSFRFYSGWAASAAGDRPDRIPVAADKPSYAPGETRACEHQAGRRRQGACRRCRRSRVLLAADQCAGRRHARRHSRVGRLGRGRLCARHRLSSAQRRHGPRARALHRRHLARRRQRPAHADAAIGGPQKITAAPAHHHSRDGEGSCRRRACLSDARRGR